MAMTASTVVQKYLMGEYPTSRGELVDRAQRQGADQAVVSLVRNLQDEQFASAADVERALGEER
jgi:uncharacterized protein YidB (DUF937 family)